MVDADFSPVVRSFVPYAVLSGIAAVSVSSVYEVGYFFGVGVALSNIPLTLQDILAKSLFWMPVVALAMLYNGIYLAGGLRPSGTKIPRYIGYLLVFLLAAIALVAFFNTRHLLIPVLFGMASIGLVLSITQSLGYRLAGWLTVSVSLTLLLGSAGGLAARNGVYSDYITLRENDEVIGSVQIVRNYPSGILFLQRSGEAVFVGRDALKSTTLITPSASSLLGR